MMQRKYIKLWLYIYILLIQFKIFFIYFILCLGAAAQLIQRMKQAVLARLPLSQLSSGAPVLSAIAVCLIWDVGRSTNIKQSQK